MASDIERLKPYAFNLNLMLLDHARKLIDEVMIPIPKQTQTQMNDSEEQLPTDGEEQKIFLDRELEAIFVNQQHRL